MLHHPRPEELHELERKFNAPAVDIMEAINNGFRAQVDVKGKLAELYLSRDLEALKQSGVIDRYEWYDKDGEPDFHVWVAGKRLVMECKNIRSPTLSKKGKRSAPKVELQKTRDGLDANGKKTRGYSVDHFDILGVCLFNHTGEWRFVFIASRYLDRRPADPSRLKVMQAVPLTEADIQRLGKPWSSDLRTVIQQEAAR